MPSSSPKALILVAAGLLIVSCEAKKEGGPRGGQNQRSRPPLSVEAFIASTSSISEDVEVPGSLFPLEMTPIRAEISGRITQLNIPEGTIVPKGFLLVKIFDQDQQAQLRKLKVQLQIAIKTVQRQKELLAINGISQQDYDLSALNVDNLKAANIENTNQQLASVRKNIEVMKQTLKENRAGRSPIINFVSNYNFIQRQENEVEVQLGVTPKVNENKGYNFGLNATLPIMNSMNVNRLIGQSKVNIERQKLIYDQQLTIALVGVRIAYTSYQNAIQVLRIEEENSVLAKENVTIALEGFRRGITTFIELRTAQQSLADAFNRLIAARYNAKISETELLRLQGSLVN